MSSKRSSRCLASRAPLRPRRVRRRRADEPTSPLISKGFQHQFWQAVKLGAETGGQGLQGRHHLRRSRDRVDGRQADRHAAADLAKNPSAICFAALDSKAAIPLLKKAKERKIPVIGFDSGVDSDIPVTTAATDNVAAAALAADKMAQLIGESGKVARDHPRPDQPHRHRPRDGFLTR